MSDKSINSWEQLREQIASILAQLNSDRSLALAAAVNPLFALQELGYEIDPQSRSDIEERLRFEPRTAIRLRELRQSIFQHPGHSFDLNSPEELSRVLFDELKLLTRSPGKSEAYQQPLRSDTKLLPKQQKGIEPVSDPLEVLRNAHPLMERFLNIDV